MTKAGLVRTPDEMLLDYLDKIGMNYSKLIRFDKRLYPGESVERGGRSWEEAHIIAFDLERHSRDSEALRREGNGQRSAAVTASGGPMESDSMYGQADLVGQGLAVGAAGEVPPSTRALLRPGL